MPYWAVAVDPVGQIFPVINFSVALFAIAFFAEGLRVPDKARPILGHWLNMIQSKFFKREFLITFETMEVVELAEIIPFSDGVGAACLGFASTADRLSFYVRLLAFIGLPIPLVGLLAFIGLPIPLVGLLAFIRLCISFIGSLASSLAFIRLPMPLVGLLAFIRLCISFIGSLAFIGLPIYFDARLALISIPILSISIFTELLNRFSLSAFTTSLFHLDIIH